MRIILGVTVIALAQGMSTLSVDMPHGGCRLTVFENGGGTINFGAMPRSVTVEIGTFKVSELTRLLRANSHPQSRIPMRPEIGSVSLPGDSELRSIEHAPLVRSLLERGWKARVPPTTAQEHEDYRWVAGACLFTSLEQAQKSAA